MKKDKKKERKKLFLILGTTIDFLNAIVSVQRNIHARYYTQTVHLGIIVFTIAQYY